jgi:hypothetical protein
VLEAMWAKQSELPDLDNAVVAFVSGACEAWDEWFTDEFHPGGPIKQLSDKEWKELFFSSTNNVNGGALGSWHVAQYRWPNKTLHKFRSGFLANQNDTELFVSKMLHSEEDQAYLH